MNIEIDFDTAVDITRQTLQVMLEDIEVAGNSTDIPTWDAISQVIAYVSTPEELEWFENKPIDNHFLDLLVNESLKNFYTGLSNGNNRHTNQ